MKFTVLVPSYRRPRDLERCLAALRRQTEPAAEILVVARDGDDETIRLVGRSGKEDATVRRVSVCEPGVVAALNRGLEEAREEIVAILDDDAAPHLDWLARMRRHFEADSTVGGVGGRDYVFRDGKLSEGRRRVVGRVQWFGRVVGNHHHGFGGPRDVDTLKGVNMSFRRESIEGLRLDKRLRGQGAQVHWEVAFCLSVKRRGWRLVYDPAVSVDHFPGQRQDVDQRRIFKSSTTTDAVHNETLLLLEYFTAARRSIFLSWAVAAGTRAAPGLLQLVRLAFEGDHLAGARLRASMRGRWMGWQTWRRSRSLRSA